MSNISDKILLVDDNPYDVMLIKEALKKFDIEKNIIVAEDGEEAIGFLFQNTNPDLANGLLPKMILLDIKMPLIDGLEVLKVIRSDNSMNKVPVIMLTSSRDSKDLDLCYNLGANSFVVKPVNLNDFNYVVKQVGKYWLQINELNN